MVSKTKQTFKEWVTQSKESLEALLQQSKEEQNKKISYFEVKFGICLICLFLC